MLFIRNNTKEEYFHLAIASMQDDLTNSLFVLYCPNDDEHNIFIMEEGMFNRTFTLISPKV